MRPASTYRPTQDAPRPSSRQVLFRAVFRLVVLTALAGLAGETFGKALATLLAMSAVFCAVVAIMRREPLFGWRLSHWDEAATYAVLSYLIAALP